MIYLDADFSFRRRSIAGYMTEDERKRCATKPQCLEGIGCSSEDTAGPPKCCEGKKGFKIKKTAFSVGLMTDGGLWQWGRRKIRLLGNS